MAKQSDKSFEAIAQRIRQHLEERDWLNNSARSLAISIALEASELLEHYQWQDEAVGDNQLLANELADILIYAFQFADRNDIDIAKAIEHKLELAAKKYPAADFRGKSYEQQRDNWRKRKAHLTGEDN